MPIRDPRNKSRNNASKRTTSATRSKRAASSAKYNPKPSSAAQRSGKKGSGASKVTTGKGGKVNSPRLRQALEGVKTKRTPAKTPSKAKATGSKPVVTTPDSNPAKRGAQGPRTATPKPTNTRRTLAVSGDTGRRGATDAQGRARNQPPKPAPRNAPPTQKYKPRVSNVGPQIRQRQAIEQTNQARRVAKANPGRQARAARNTKPGRSGLIGALTTGAQIGNAMAQNLSRRATPSNRGAGRATENVKAGPPKKEERAVKGPTQKPTRTPKPVDKNPIKAPPKKDSTVLAKKNGKEGVLRNGVFYATGWSPAQRNRYQVEKNKNQK